MGFRVQALAIGFVLGSAAFCRAEPVAIIGGTVIDLSNSGHSSNDIPDSVVLLENDKILAVGLSSQITLPPHTTRIQAQGKFIVPGLIDGFGTLHNQAFANAYLYEGVTTVYVPTVVPGGGGDGQVDVLRTASPGPRLFLGAPMTGYSEDGADPSDKPMIDHRLHDQRLTNQHLIKRIDTLAAQGFRGITISYDVWPDQFDVIAGEARRRGLATLGEPGFTSYPYAIRAGVDTLPHDDHFTFELAPALAQLTRADNLVANREAVRAVCAVDPTSDEATAYGGQLANSHTTLMPTLAMEATADLLDVPNPWNARSSVLIDAADIDTPTDKATGASAYLASAAPERREVIRKCAWHKEALDARFYRLGARFLAGSNAGSYGSLPGSGLHLELALLHRIGLSPREALAAATTNYADVYGWQDVGRIEPGRVADLLILDADPRADLSALEHIHTLVFRGKVVDREKLLTLDGRPAAP